MAEPELLEYDLSDWDEESRGSLEWMLTGRNITFEWDRERHGVLVVLERDEKVVDDFVDYVAAGPAAEPEQWDDTFYPKTGSVDPIDVDSFYEIEPARADSEELEFGEDWENDDGARCELMWVRNTGELCLVTMRGKPEVEILGTCRDESTIRLLLDGWEQAMYELHSVTWIRDRVRGVGSAPSPTPVAESPVIAEPTPVAPPDLSDGWWTPPAAIGWITNELDDLARSYAEWRASLHPDAALEAAINEALDESTKGRLIDFFGGEMDVVYGDGSGERTRIELRDALEQRMLPSP